MKMTLTLIAGLTATTALAADLAVPLTYEVFETSVAHTDLETCPKNLPQTETFCRATLYHDEIHVFAFSENGDSPMVGFNSYPLEEIALHLK
ncbi:hypothetical protein [Ruegeria arenilitoris]|uniref:hypothetical protein n=1 Tax=Ruegeria arenilitoris TaxID=1173585 RepID=UPI00147B7AB8|nr:hypothetical protein [Ruegeria arenilitoris]